jgi:adenylate kinase|tara:strand:- start:65 stop:706 length:642 start_codon:yes stop_codon:yes gene_type:complete
VNIILFGPPGAGKGTQAQQIVNKHNYFQLSTGDILRDEVKNKTDLGKDIKDKISKGNFVSDTIVNELLKKTISELRFRDRIIFDGYPRTVEQSKNLDKILLEFNEKIDLIFSLHVPRDVIEKRIVGRVICEKCNTTLNKFFNKNEIKLHPCGAEHFVKREDDNSETLMNRYDIYIETTKPVINFLSKNKNFHQIDGTLKISEITDKIDTFINV